jgi:hypothetical protein
MSTRRRVLHVCNGTPTLLHPLHCAVSDGAFTVPRKPAQLLLLVEMHLHHLAELHWCLRSVRTYTLLAGRSRSTTIELSPPDTGSSRLTRKQYKLRPVHRGMLRTYTITMASSSGVVRQSSTGIVRLTFVSLIYSVRRCCRLSLPTKEKPSSLTRHISCSRGSHWARNLSQSMRYH